LLIWNALVKLTLKVVDSDDSKDEEEEKHHDHYITDIFEGNRDSLNSDLEVLIDRYCAQRSQKFHGSQCLERIQII